MVTGFLPASIPPVDYELPMGSLAYGTFTNASPHNFTYSVNNPM